MAYSNIISRTDAQALVPEVVAEVLMTETIRDSAALQLFRNVQMGTNQTRIPVISALPTAYFINGDTGLKQTTEVDWTNKYLNAEEIAAIVPIPQAVLDDARFDVWGNIRPLLAEAIGRALDAAVFFGTNKPASWPTEIVTAAINAGNYEARGTNNQANGGIAGDLSDIFGMVEADGYDVTGMVSNVAYRGRLRQTRATTGQRLPEINQMVNTDSAFGIDIAYPMRGLWPTGSGAAEVIAGDFAEGVMGVRQDITYKILSEAVIQDNTGAILYNLAQQDMVAMRVVARFAWQVPNPIRYDQQVEANRWPFAVLRAP